MSNHPMPIVIFSSSMPGPVARTSSGGPTDAAPELAPADGAGMAPSATGPVGELVATSAGSPDSTNGSDAEGRASLASVGESDDRDAEGSDWSRAIGTAATAASRTMVASGHTTRSQRRVESLPES